MSECAFYKNRNCTILKTTNCKKCSFRKTEEQLEEGRKKAKRRINSLPKVMRESIKEKYHPLEKVCKEDYE